MKLKELEKPYKTETHLDHFTKAQDLITSAIFSGWKIDFEVDFNEDYEADDKEEYPSLVKTYVWAPERWGEDYISELHLLTWTYPQAVIELAARLKKVIQNYNCPYCSMLNGHGKEWDMTGKKVCIVCGYNGAKIVNFEDYIRDEYAQRISITHCPFCGRNLANENS